MKADDVVELRELWSRTNYGSVLPAATVIAEHDWLSYVAAMTEAVPVDDRISFPNEQDVLWAWPDGVCIIFSTPVEVNHTIISDVDDLGRRQFVDPHTEDQIAAGFVVFPQTFLPVALGSDPLPEEPDTVTAEMIYEMNVPAIPTEMLTRPLLWIGADPLDIVTGHWMPNVSMQSQLGRIAHSTRMQLAIITALGHRLTRVEQISGGRHERRRAERAVPGLRVLQLATGATVRSEGTGTVEWSKRWMVRGHWRLQPHGPKRAQRKPIWIDPYVKGPEDKPLDVRPTVWRASHDE